MGRAYAARLCSAMGWRRGSLGHHAQRKITMCARYNLISPPEAVRALFGLGDIEPFPPRYNIAPGQPVAIVRQGHRGRELALVRWGLIPSWVKDPREFAMVINARAETAAEKPSFRGSLRHRRCIVPASGYYEWTGRAGAKIPHLFRPADNGLLALAGLWEHWLGADGSELETMAILTVAANRSVAAIHERMPLILNPSQFDSWLDCRAGSAVDIMDMLVPSDDVILGSKALKPALNNPRLEGPELWTPLDDTFF